MCRLLLETLIFSDSHGRADGMRAVIEAHPNARYVLFCGDGAKEVMTLEAQFPQKIFVAVKGNCDLFSDLPEERVFALGGYKVLLMHGHTHGVKGGYGFAAKHACDAGAELLIFGHTHLPYEGRMQVGDATVNLFNPGSIGKRASGNLSYGILTVGENGYLFSHGTFED